MISLLVMVAVVHAVPQPMPRRAVVVGSNTAIDGRSSLRFAHGDARSIAEVLIDNGGFAPDQITTLLDAEPAEILAALDAARTAIAGAKEESLLVFYYSGHADHGALYPAGRALPLTALRERLSDASPGVRIGIIDACRGGGWTQAKGLEPAAPFDIGMPALSSEGTALLSASSGLEDAHEAEVLKGSFFTHYLVAGLRGAADASGDGQVTLSEAFASANRLTIRDTATRSRVPQHPSFDLKLRGRQDVVLASLHDASTQLVLAQKTGPLEVVQLSTGVTVVEAAPGEQILRLTLPPGPYLVRRLSDAGVVHSKEVQVKANHETRLEESSLTLVGSPDLPTKGTTSERGQHELSVGAGVAPLDAFVTGLTGTVDYTWHFSRLFGVRASATGNIPFVTRLRDQLERDFGVLPSAFDIVDWALYAGLTFSPTLGTPSNHELRLNVTAGPGVMHLHGLLAGVSLAPALAANAALTWFFLEKDWGSTGVRLTFGDVVGFANGGVMHFATAGLSLVVAMGPPR